MPNISEGRIQTIKKASRAAGAEELAELLMAQGVAAFQDNKDADAAAWRQASWFAAGWAKNEREVQARLEKQHGRYDG